MILQSLTTLHNLNALILAVSHAEFARMDAAALQAMFRCPEAGIVMDVKGCLDKTSLSGLTYWRL